MLNEGVFGGRRVILSFRPFSLAVEILSGRIGTSTVEGSTGRKVSSGAFTGLGVGIGIGSTGGKAGACTGVEMGIGIGEAGAGVARRIGGGDGVGVGTGAGGVGGLGSRIGDTTGSSLALDTGSSARTGTLSYSGSFQIAFISFTDCSRVLGSTEMLRLALSPFLSAPLRSEGSKVRYRSSKDKATSSIRFRRRSPSRIGDCSSPSTSERWIASGASPKVSSGSARNAV